MSACLQDKAQPSLPSTWVYYVYGSFWPTWVPQLRGFSKPSCLHNLSHWLPKLFILQRPCSGVTSISFPAPLLSSSCPGLPGILITPPTALALPLLFQLFKLIFPPTCTWTDSILWEWTNDAQFVECTTILKKLKPTTEGNNAGLCLWSKHIPGLLGRAPQQFWGHCVSEGHSCPSVLKFESMHM